MKKGMHLLLHESYLYKVKRSNKNITFWMCTAENISVSKVHGRVFFVRQIWQKQWYQMSNLNTEENSTRITEQGRLPRIAA